jgi:predicted N-acetyltransferase YhbS
MNVFTRRRDSASRGLVLPSRAMGIVIRAARRADLPAVYHLLDAAFTDAPVQLFIDQTEGDSTMRLRHIRVAEVDGRIAAHVRIFARRMLVRGVPVRAGGIGSVASAPDARGLGLPSALLHDALDVMARDGVAVSFLFTGIPALYERLGWRIVAQPAIEADPPDAAAPDTGGYRVRPIAPDDLRALLSIYREATAGSTGAIVRTAGTWRDAETWLGEDPAGCLLAERDGRAAAYIRSRSREYGYHILELEHRRGHGAAVDALLATAARRAAAKRQRLYATVPDPHSLAAAMRAMPAMVETAHMRYPTMMRIVSLDALVASLLPRLDASARSAAVDGASFTLGLRAPDGQSVTLDVTPSRVRLRRTAPRYTLDESSTLDALLGQRRASDLVRPRPPAEVRRRIDGLLPETAFHFWNSDRI